jgi:hypothetical protein
MKPHVGKPAGLVLGFILFGCTVYFVVIPPDGGTLSSDGLPELEAARASAVRANDNSADDEVNASVVAAAAFDGTPKENDTIITPKATRTDELAAPTPSRTSSVQTKAQSEESSQATQIVSEPAPTQPLVFAEDSPSPNLSPEVVGEIASLRRQFVEEIGGYDQDPSDPEYARRWEEARQLLDEQLRTQLGEETFDTLQNESVTQVAPESPED